MRLIRLYKDYEANVPLGSIANFNNNFQADIVLKPNSQLALQSIAIDTVDVAFTIDSSNNRVQWGITDEAFYDEFLIAPGDYNSTNVNLLTDRLTEDFNASTTFDIYNDAVSLLPYYLGIEWLVEINKNAGSKLEIGYKIGDLYWTDASKLIRAANVNIADVDDDRKTFSLVSPDNAYASADFDKCIINQKYLSKGCGCVRAQGMKLDDNQGPGSNGQGYIVGLVNDPTIAPEDLELSDIKYGIHYTIFQTGIRKYQVIINGVRSNAGDENPIYTEESADNDIQEVMINGEEIFFNIYQNGVAQPYVLNSDEGIGLGNGGVVPYDGDPLYPVLVFFSGDDYVIVDNFISTESQYQNNPTVPDNYYPTFGHALQPETVENGAGLAEISENYLEFETGEIANFLGYDDRIIGPTDTGPSARSADESRDYIAQGENKFNPDYFADSFLVELKNIPLDSFDGLKEARKNVLAYIAHSDADGSFNYEVNNPIFVDLNNKKEILLRNVEANLLYGDYSEFGINSDATMVLLIKEKGE